MYRISNGILTVDFDDNGRLVFLRNPACGSKNIIDEPASYSFCMTTELGECKENLAFSSQQQCNVAITQHEITFSYSTITTFDGQNTHELPIKLALTASLNGDCIQFKADIDNQSDARILDFTYPVIGKIRSLCTKAPALLLPAQTGVRYQNIAAMLGSMQPHRENSSNSLCSIYPGSLSMQWMALTDDINTLFLSGRDSDCYPTELRQQGEPKNNTVTLEFSKMLCLEAHAKMVVAPYLVTLYHGNWHRDAAEYASWMNSCFPRCEPAPWAKNMTGYFLVINKQQFGYEMWPYASLPKLYELAQQHGCDTLGLFGWYQSGHDNQYPDLQVGKTLGGEDALKQAIAEVRAKGANVTLYYQGHLIDEGSDFFRTGPGREVCSKNIWGNPYVEFYSKSHKSSFLKNFSRKMFAIACPSSATWQELMVAREDWLASFGPSGCLYDQIGGCPPYICFDKKHQHEKNSPALANTKGRKKMLGMLQKHAKEISPDFAFMSEHIVDTNSSFLDAVHGIGTVPPPEGVVAKVQLSPETPRFFEYPALFRYCFPGTVITMRNPNPFITHRFANYALAYGFRPEMELRYQADCDDVLADKYAEERRYLLKVAKLRKEYANLLLHGTFRDEQELEEMPFGIIATCFVNDRQMACVLWNDTNENIDLSALQAKENWQLVECATVDAVSVSMPETLASGAIAVVLFAQAK